MKFYSSGKILLTGEYLVLQGAKALSLPTKSGQFLEVSESKENVHKWNSYDNLNKLWFRASFSLDLQTIINTTDLDKAKLLQQILTYTYYKDRNLFKNPLVFDTYLEFNREWGLGSSSTFINNLSLWSKQNPFEMLGIAMGGSGYDIAVAKEQKPIVYQLIGKKPNWNTVDFNKSFTGKLFFIYLNKKQNSSKEIKNFNKLNVAKKDISKISEITQNVVLTNNINEFEELLFEHEQIISKILNRPTVKQSLFPDFQGTIKSLGAWGGDFVLAIGDNIQEYFKAKDYKTILTYKDFIRHLDN